MSHARAGFNSDLASVGEARRFVRRALVGMGAEDLEFEACQLVSELATNAVIHAGTPFDVDLDFDNGELSIRVTDSSPKSPMTKSHSEHATTGRGLRLVGTMADEWGVELRPGGKTVWCTVRPGPAPERVKSYSSADEPARRLSRSRGPRSVDGFSSASWARSTV